MAELMSVRGYAKSRGIAHTSVGYQIKKRNIPLVDGKVDAEYMDHVFREKVDAKQSLRGRGQQRVGGGLPTAPAAVAPTLPDDPNDLEAIRRRVPKDYNDAAYLQAVEELLKRRAANAEMEGRLADAEKVLRAQFEMARQVRDLMMAIPSRVDDMLASESTAVGCRRILEGEIRQALEEAAKLATRLAEEGGALDAEEDGAG